MRKCLTELVFFAMVGYSKKVVGIRDTPLLFIGCGRLLFLISSKAIILYVNKRICLSIYTPWHLKNLWHPYKGVYKDLKGIFVDIDILPYFKWSLFRLSSITITWALSGNINYHQQYQLSVVGGWGQLTWCYTHYAVFKHL